MQYLARAILSSFLPRFGMRSRGIKVVLALAGVIAVILVGSMLLRLRGSSALSLPEDLGLKALHMTDGKGDQWTIEPVVGQPFARLRERLKDPGPPLVVRTDMQREGPSRVSVGLTIEGQAGERYSPAISKNAVVLPAPEFSVVNEAGAVIFKDRFEYG